MTALFKEGDIVYFIKEFRSHYSSGYYYHKLNQPYKVIDWNTGFGIQNGTIQNLQDMVCHFAHSTINLHLIYPYFVLYFKRYFYNINFDPNKLHYVYEWYDLKGVRQYFLFHLFRK